MSTVRIETCTMVDVTDVVVGDGQSNCVDILSTQRFEHPTPNIMKSRIIIVKVMSIGVSSPKHYFSDEFIILRACGKRGRNH